MGKKEISIGIGILITLLALAGIVSANIISILPPNTTVNNQGGEKRTFMITDDQVMNVSWQINGNEVFSAKNVTTSTYINSSAAPGIWNVTAVASNINSIDQHTWDWIVSPPPVINVEIKNFAFNPQNINIPKGTTVIWTNNDIFAHTVTSDTGIFDSGAISPGQTFEWAFNQSGTFDYHCSIHLFMRGEVTVTSTLPVPPPVEDIGIGLGLIAENLTAPIGLIPSGDGRLFIIDQIGLIKIINSSGQILDEPFLDLRSKMVTLNPQYDERGLLGLAFHPGFSQNGRFFVYYSAPLRPGAPANFDHTSTISEFRVSQNDQNRANESSERILLQIDKPQFNHNAGQITFGPDGYLYIPEGDGGNANDEGIGHPPPGNGQNTSAFLGKILRIDVDTGTPYGIPPDNPFVGKDGLDEIFAYGFRNPFRISFDAGGSHSLFVSDAGQNAWEEVDIVTRGENYGWNIKEGTHCFDPNNPNLSNLACPGVSALGQPLTDPVIEYANAGQPGGIGIAVIGGFVYRGNALPQFNGTYIFGDFSKSFSEANGSLFVGRPPSQGEKMWSMKELQITTSGNGRVGAFVRSFGQDGSHEVYVMTSQKLGPENNTGKIYKIIDNTPPLVSFPTSNQSSLPTDTDHTSLWGETARLNVTVTDDMGVASVTVNLSGIGGAFNQLMTNIAGNIYSTTTNASANTLPGFYNLTVNATDISRNSNTSVSIQLRVMKNGDCTGNDVVNIGDALRLANNVSHPGNPLYDLSSPYVCDVTGNGVINIGDALRLANNVSHPGNLAYILK